MTETSSREAAELLAPVREMALEAGHMLLDGLDTVHTIDAKAGTEFVTEMDRRVEDHLLERLARLFPDDAVQAEESDERIGRSGRIWYVDPLDGSTNYAHGYAFFSVSIACADAERLLAGTVHAPYLDEMYQAAFGCGATGERPSAGGRRDLVPREAVHLEQALLATGFPYRRDELVDRNTALVRDFLKARCHGVRRGGSAAVDLCHVAAGKLDGYWEYRLRPWDTAAGTLIAREAGANVTGIDGAAGRLHVDDILAAAPGLHEQMAALIARAQRETK